MKEPMDVRLSIGFWFMNVLLALPTLGLLPLIFLLQTRRWPRRLESDHLILRNGTRIPWSECSNVVKQPGWGRYDVIFGGTTVPVATFSLARGKKVVQWICERLNVTFDKK